jgi:hypothetical protein
VLVFLLADLIQSLGKALIQLVHLEGVDGWKQPALQTIELRTWRHMQMIKGKSVSKLKTLENRRLNAKYLNKNLQMILCYWFAPMLANFNKEGQP